MPPFERGLVVVFALVHALGQLDLAVRDFPVRNARQDVRDAVQPAAALVVRAHDIPGRALAVSKRRVGKGAKRRARALINLPMPIQSRLFFVYCCDPGMLGHYKGTGGDAYLATERPVERYDHHDHKRERGCDDAGHRQVHAEVLKTE
jgi:hypothetical protein